MPTSRRRSNPPQTVLYEFPYVKFHGRSYPLIPLRLKKGKLSVKTFGLLDSGASVSVFRPEIARALDIRKNGAGSIRLDTATGGMDIDLSDLEIKIGRTQFKARIGFSEMAANFNIIGREGFFHRFSICFNEMMRTVILVPLDKLRS